MSSSTDEMLPKTSIEKKRSNDLPELPELNFVNDQFCSRRFLIYLTTAPKDLNLEKSGTGDIDYRNTLAYFLKKKFPDIIYLIEKKNDEKEIFDIIEQTKATKHPILHIIINTPNTGCLFSLDALKAFKTAGGRLIVTILEHEKHHLLLKKQSNDYIELADHCIFLDIFDKNSALETINETNLRLQTIVQSSSIISVPSTLQFKCLPFKQRGKDILHFCMFRQGSGFEETIELAEQIKNSTDPELQDRQIWRVGSVFEHKEKREDDTLLNFMLKIYPTKASEIETWSDPDYLKMLLKQYTVLEEQGKLKRELPIRLVVDCPENELIPIFNACQYAFSPKHHGADLRHSSTSTLLNLQFIIISHVGKKTTACLQMDGEYNDAMALLQTKENAEYKTAKEYAQFAYNQIKERTRNPKLNDKSLSQIEKLVSKHLSENVISEQHIAIYEKVCNRSISLLLLSIRKIREQWLAFQAFKQAAYANRAFKSFENKHKAIVSWKYLQDPSLQEKRITDMTQQMRINFRTLLNDLKNCQGYLNPDMKILLAEKSPKAVLHPSEKMLLRCLVRTNKMRFKHKTHSINIAGILKTRYLRTPDERYRELTREQRNLSADEKLEVEQLKLRSHTGRSDFVYSTTGSYYPKTIDFLLNEEEEIIGDIDTIIDNNPYLLTGTHIIDKLKRAGEGNYAFPQIDLAIYLMLIQQLRSLGKEIWETVIKTIISNESNQADYIENLLQTLIPPRIIECLTPCKIRIDQYGIKYQSAKNYETGDICIENSKWMIIKVRSTNNLEREGLRSPLSLERGEQAILNSNDLCREESLDSQSRVLQTYILSRDTGMFPFLKMSDPSSKTAVDYFNKTYSLKLEEERCTIDKLFSGNICSANVLYDDSFYLCELELNKNELQILKNQAHLDIVEINGEIASAGNCFNFSEDYSAIHNSRKFCALTLFLLNVCARKSRHLIDLQDMKIFLLFKNIYEKTYLLHKKIYFEILQKNVEIQESFKSPFFNPFIEFRYKNKVNAPLIYLLLRYYDHEFVNNFLRDNPGCIDLELSKITISSIPLHNKINFQHSSMSDFVLYDFDDVAVCYEKNLSHLFEFYVRHLNHFNFNLKDLLNNMHPFFIHCYRSAPPLIKNQVSIVETLLWKNLVNPWGTHNKTKTQNKYDRMSVENLAELFQLALCNEKLTLEDYEELIYISFLYLEKGYSIIADTIFPFLDFPNLKIDLAKRSQQLIELGIANVANRKSLENAIETLSDYWNTQEERHGIQYRTPREFPKFGQESSCSPCATARSVQDISKNEMIIPEKNLPLNKKVFQSSHPLANIDINYQKLALRRNLDTLSVFSILLVQNNDGEYCFILDLNSQHYYPFLQETIKNPTLEEREPTVFEQFNKNLRLGYDPRNIQWSHLGRAYVNLGSETEYHYHSFYVGFLNKLSSAQFSILENSDTIAIIPFSKLSSVLNQKSSISKVSLKKTSLCFTKLTEFLLTHVKSQIWQLPNSLKGNKEFNEIFDISHKNQCLFFNDIKENKSVEIIEQHLKSGYINIYLISSSFRNQTALDYCISMVRDVLGFNISDQPGKSIYDNGIYISNAPNLVDIIRSIIRFRAELDLKYFKSDYYRVIALANVDDAFDFTDHYQSLDEKQRKECYEIAYLNLSPHAKTVYKFIINKENYTMPDNFISTLEGPFDNNNRLRSYLLVKNNYTFLEKDKDKIEAYANAVLSDLFQFSLKNKNFTDLQIEEIGRMSVWHLNRGDSRIATDIQNGLFFSDLKSTIHRCISTFEQSDSADSDECIKDAKRTLNELSDYFADNNRDGLHL